MKLKFWMLRSAGLGILVGLEKWNLDEDSYERGDKFETTDFETKKFYRRLCAGSFEWIFITVDKVGGNVLRRIGSSNTLRRVAVRVLLGVV